ncbi:tyrosine-type recombinase/integrase [Silvanigrella aquatica]|uniref:Integrase n=1 Tax=Silvanigrella aquatica TaxID=1915309 RepID=A0A1L4CYR2_9BACT|nr:tyrosine-type recombinase/integrase [Silvanigrella aquatica]APJ03088.1 hypothetical protein AXG55_03855 [Silvanigrella aquatica]
MEQNKSKIKKNSLIPSDPRLISLQNLLHTSDFLAEWTQKELSTDLNDVVTHFLLSFTSIHTKRSYLNDLKDFIYFASSHQVHIHNVSQIDEKLLILWHNSLNEEKNLTQKTIRRKLNALSSLLEFCRKRKLILQNPMQFIKKPKYVEESKTNAFTIDEVKEILNYLKQECERLSSENTQSRIYKSTLLKYTIMVTLFSVGMRVEELCSLKIKDIEFCSDFTRIKMMTKGQKEHSPLIHAKTAEVIKNYINCIRLNAKEDEYLFIRIQNVSDKNKLSQVAIYNIVNETARKVGIEKKVSPHSCRASLATILHNQGVPIGQIQSLLNHKEVTTTAIYVKKANELEESAALKLNLLKLK